MLALWMVQTFVRPVALAVGEIEDRFVNQLSLTCSAFVTNRIRRRTEQLARNCQLSRLSCSPLHREHSEILEKVSLLGMLDHRKPDTHLMLQHGVFAFGILSHNANVDVFMSGWDSFVWFAFQNIDVQIQFVSQSNISGDGFGRFTFRFDVSYNRNGLGKRPEGLPV